MQANGKNVKALLISVHYGDPRPTLELLRCFLRTKHLSELHLMIVGNKSADGSSSALQDAISGLANIELFELTANAGYFGAAKAGLERFLDGNKVLPEWVIVCNHDVLIEDTDFFGKLFAQDPMAAGVIAPRIQVLPGRAEQNPFMLNRPGWLRWTGLRLIYSAYSMTAFWHWLSRQKGMLRSAITASNAKSSGSNGGNREHIYAAHGAFFIFSRRYFEAGGFLDKNLFLYFEEICVAEICRSLRLPVIYEPSLSVLHKEHCSTGERVSRFSYECHKKALRYIRSHYLSGSREFVGSCRPDVVP